MSQREGYQAGDLKFGLSPTQDEWDADDFTDYDQPLPRFGDEFSDRRIAWLPHSCDQWVIGSKEEVKALISDLQDALAFMEKP
jgi:hypothetical protein